MLQSSPQRSLSWAHLWPSVTTTCQNARSGQTLGSATRISGSCARSAAFPATCALSWNCKRSATSLQFMGTNVLVHVIQLPGRLAYQCIWNLKYADHGYLAHSTRCCLLSDIFGYNHQYIQASASKHKSSSESRQYTVIRQWRSYPPWRYFVCCTFKIRGQSCHLVLVLSNTLLCSIIHFLIG